MPAKYCWKKPLTEFYVDGSFTEDRAVWLHELQRLCEEVYDNDKEMADKHKERIAKLQRVTNIAWKMSELLKSQLTLCSKPGPGGQRTWWTRRFGRRVDDQGGLAGERYTRLRDASKPASWVRKVLPTLGRQKKGIAEEARRRSKEGDQNKQAMAFTSVMSERYATCILTSGQEEEEPEGCEAVARGRS